MDPIRPPRRSPQSTFIGPQAVFTSLWTNRELVFRLAWREIEARYRGSLLGLAWSVLNPLLMLSVYTIVFSMVFETRWGVSTEGGKAEFAMILFAGMIVFSVLADSLNRAPGLIVENRSYVKKVVFPLEVLPWIALVGTLFNALVSVGVLLVAHVLLVGVPPWTCLLFPLTILPIVPLALGLSWIFASIGVYFRDLQQFIGNVTTMLLFVSPIFYPLSSVPPGLRRILVFNPITVIIEQTRGVMLFGEWPDFGLLGLYGIVAWGIAWLGLVWFSRTRKGFADVL